LTGILAEILAHKRGEVEQARAVRPLDQLKSLAGYYLPRRNFYGAVTAPGRKGPNLIAEVKRRSPSAGVIQPDFDPVRMAQQYAAGGARALSVLTDERYFGGRLEYIEAIKAAVGLPVLRKDFLVDAYQVYESRAGGADAVLVIGEALESSLAVELVALARSLELCVLLEVHTRAALLTALEMLHADAGGNILLGINNRDLATQRVDLSTLEQLAPLVSPGVPIVSESGVQTRQDVERLHAAGARAILVGETLMRSGDPARTIRALFG
jgi:indole-3-glycerol phosphate synthase